MSSPSRTSPHRPNGAGSTTGSLKGLYYEDRDTFIESHHDKILNRFATTFVGTMISGGHKMPRRPSRKADKRAMRKAPLRTVDEECDRAHQEQQEYEAAQHRRRTTLGGAASPYIQLSSSEDESDEVPGVGSSSSSSDSTDSDTSYDSQIEVRMSPAERGREASLRVEIEGLQSSLQEVLQRLNEIKDAHIPAAQAQVDELTQNLVRAREAATSAASTPGLSGTQQKARTVGLQRRVTEAAPGSSMKPSLN